MPTVRISRSVRFVYAMFRLYADLESSFGKALIDILKKQYPDQKVDISPSQLGHKLMAIARAQHQNDEQRAMDSIQDLLAYYTLGSQYETRDGKIQYKTDPKTGEKEPIQRSQAKPWDFAKDFPTWQEALSNVYTNLRRKSISRSKSNTTERKKTKSVDDAFGSRGEGGGAPEGGEGAIPTPDSNSLSKALDDQASIHRFMEVIEDNYGDLQASLTPDSRALFDLIMEDNIGTFGADIDENMNQASALREKNPDLYKKHEKRWSGFVGDLRKKVLQEIWDFLDNNLTQTEFNEIKEFFFGDTDPSYIRRKEREKSAEKDDDQVGKDERKYSKLKWKKDQGALSPAETKEMDRLRSKLEGVKIDPNAIPAEEAPNKKGWKLHKKAASSASHVLMAVRIAAGFVGR